MFCFLTFFVRSDLDPNALEIRPNTTSYLLPSSTKKIQDFAFVNSTSTLVSVSFSKCTELSTIGKGCFENCTKLKSIDLSPCKELNRIGDRAFYNCSSLSTFIFPNECSIKVIGSSCFVFVALESIQIPASIVLLQSNPDDYGLFASSSLKNITFAPKSSLNTLNPKLFSHSSISSIILPSSIQTISPLAFAFCNNLQEIEFENDNNPTFTIFEGCIYSRNCEYFVYVPSAFTGNITLHNSTKEIDSYSFSFSKISKVHLSDSVETIKSYAFYQSSITHISFGYNIESIEEYAFADCQKLNSMTLPSIITVISEGLFMNCSKIVNINFGNIIEIKSHAFYNCWSLVHISPLTHVTEIGKNAFALTNFRSIVIPKDLTQWNNILWGSKVATINVAQGNSQFIVQNKMLFSYDLEILYFVPITQNSTITLPENLKEIAERAFYGSNLKFIYFPDSLKKIGAYAFYMCEHLVNVKLPLAVRTIHQGTFSVCGNLKSVTFSDEIDEIDEEAFWRCKSLMFVTFPDSLRLIKSNSFGKCQNLKYLRFIGNPVLEEDAFSGCPNISCILWESATVQTMKNAGFSEKLLNQCTLESIKEDVDSRPPTSDGIVDSYITKITPQTFKTSKNVLAILSFETESQLIEIESFSFKEFTKLSVVDFRNCKSLKKLGESAFYGCKQLSTVMFPVKADIKLIGASCFAYTDIEKITLTNSINGVEGNITSPGIFEGCERLISVATAKSNLNQICHRMFANTKITKLFISSGIKMIEGSAFLGCDSLQEFEIANNNRNFQLIKGSLYYRGDGKFAIIYASKEYTEKFICLPAISEISSGAFASCLFSSIELPANLNKIGHFAFSHCSNLTYIDVPNTVTSFGDGVFEFCTSLENIKINLNISRIPRMFFMNCIKLESFVVQYEVKVIETKAFYNCSNLTVLTGLLRVQEIQNFAFTFSGIVTFYISPELKFIGKDVFRDCEDLEEFSISFGNIYFTFFCGGLYSYDFSTLITTTAGKYQHICCTRWMHEDWRE
ncbi:surface antigen BspA-like [Trichomonas vaginalis G3]|uniref:Surface antigen BspA-like n=1 Tax=Trichomonas vaginalis (strain ATCC PRA-98 / G3) TaxID=412133 RepID=A2FG44_TRIV3|nr:surface antigen BspA-like [Trichomonas vaginalis G3]|eukprot:XP_001309051.1 surface antigen BspA-like [Trichomonas vaginalis G3]